MSRKPDSPNPDKVNANLKALRQQIDKLDQSILDALSKRASIAAQIGKVKADQGGEVFSASREEEVLQNILSNNRGPLQELTLKSIFRELISASRALQRVQRVAFLGPDYSYSHLAALERFGEAVEYMRVGSIAAVFEEVNRKHVDLGIVPLENSTDGRITDTLDMLVMYENIKICSEVRLIVHHQLLANCGQMEIRRVYSKAQALSQCRNWLSKNLPQASLHEVSSTAAATQLALSESGAAAVASRQAGIRNGIRILFENIEDYPNNETRFAVIGTADSEKTGNDKTALLFQIGHTPGALADVLQVFKQNKINLTWIESFPFRQAKGEYVFFVDFEGHRDDPKVKKTLAALEGMCESLRLLGSFPVSRLAD